MGGCPGHRKLRGQTASRARHPQLQAFLGPSTFQQHAAFRGGPRLPTRGRHDPARLPAISSNSPRGVGVYGEFYGTEDGSGCELTCCHPHLQTRTEHSGCPSHSRYCSRAHVSATILYELLPSFLPLIELLRGVQCPPKNAPRSSLAIVIRMQNG